MVIYPTLVTADLAASLVEFLVLLSAVSSEPLVMELHHNDIIAHLKT